MARLVPAIHVFFFKVAKDVDARDERGHDGSHTFIIWKLTPSRCDGSDIHLQRRDEGFLRDVDLAELAHALFAFFLLVEQLALA